MQAARPLFAHHLLRRGPDIGFDATTANGTHNGAVVANQYLRAFVARNRPLYLNDGGQSALAPLFS